MQLLSFAAPELGAFVLVDEAGSNEVKWIALFGRGFDGRDLCVFGSSTPETPSTFALTRRSSAPTRVWPSNDDVSSVDVGECEAVIKDNTLLLTYSLDRDALGWPAVDFSPPAPKRVTGTLTLARLV